MDYEKKYKEALERARAINNGEDVDVEAGTTICEYIFPELKESEDERIRKTLIDFFNRGAENGAQTNGVCDKDIIAWLEKQKTSEEALQYLRENHSSSEMSDFQTAMNIAVAKAYDKGYNDGLEKQGEQIDWRKHIKYESNSPSIIKENPAWSEEDERQWNNIYDVLDGHFELSEKGYKNAANWFKAIKGRVQPQQEWSKDDKVMLDDIIDFFENGTVKLQHDLSLYASWLKSLRPQSSWKPSDEQMMALNSINTYGGLTEVGQGKLLLKLYEDLKKL